MPDLVRVCLRFESSQVFVDFLTTVMGLVRVLSECERNGTRHHSHCMGEQSVQSCLGELAPNSHLVSRRYSSSGLLRLNPNYRYLADVITSLLTSSSRQILQDGNPYLVHDERSVEAATIWLQQYCQGNNVSSSILDEEPGGS